MAATSRQLAQAIAQAAYDSKASDIAIFDLRGSSSVTEYAVLCTATSIPHLRALLREVEGKVENAVQAAPVYAERTSAALWAVLDYVDVMVHIMSGELRNHYRLEELWEKGSRIEWAPLAAS
ncbi:MAG: ribosome silencing factor [Akkermansiaceae bacterium]|nr:ribosome silencing factor [Akkermansia sp.]MCD7798076.1 ribosome silencing factor [Akkermansiaceae bacterium]